MRIAGDRLGVDVEAFGQFYDPALWDHHAHFYYFEFLLIFPSYEKFTCWDRLFGLLWDRCSWLGLIWLDLFR